MSVIKPKSIHFSWQLQLFVSTFIDNYNEKCRTLEKVYKKCCTKP